MTELGVERARLTHGREPLDLLAEQIFELRMMFAAIREERARR